MTLPSEVDVAIIGAGAAGLAAARALQERPLSVIVLEARERIGGRAHTALSAELPLDLGCGWLHSADRNAFARMAPALGFTLDKTSPGWGHQSGDVGFSKNEQRAFRRAMSAFDARVQEAAKRPQDHPASACLDPNERWSTLIDAVGTYINGAELARVSVKDAGNYVDTDVNWRVVEGYGALIARFGADCPVALGTEVLAVDHSGARVLIDTARGTLSARAAIVTVPTRLIADEAIRFRPALPDKIEAARGLPLGLANKLFLETREPDAFEADGHLFGDIDRVGTGSYHLRPFGRPLIEAFFSGACAFDLEREGPRAAAAFALDELAGLLGNGIRRTLTPLTVSAWNSDPFARGTYSYAAPGHAGDRARLAAPVEQRLFFAGEATSPDFFSTAHGAYESGLRAASEAAAALA